MPTFKNPEMKKLRPEGGRRITFYTDSKLDEWLKQIPLLHYPSLPKISNPKEAYALMVLLWYTGARPSELVTFEKHHIYPLNDGQNNYGFAVSIYTKKRRDSYIRKIAIPYNDYTIKAYQFIQDSSPVGFYFHAFKGKLASSTYTVKWVNKRTIYVRVNGELVPETMIENKIRTYTCYNTLIRRLIYKITGLPPLYFRHHRFSWMARLGATTKQIQEFKGASDPRSVEDYIQYSDQAAKQNLAFFPK